MAGEPVFPAFTRIEHQPNPGAANSFAAEVDKILAGAKGKLTDFSAEARRTLDTALSVPRNQAGSLDLGIPQLKQAAEVQRQRAAAAEEVYRATLRAAQAQGTYSQAERQTIAATKALWQEEREAAQAAMAHANASELLQRELNQQKSATDLVVSATRRGTDATGSVINSQRASRVAFVQTGQQLQDMVIQWQAGTRASQIFAQQVPQMAFALSGLANSANATQARIGRFATFLSGPWGAAIFAATAVLGPFIFKMFESGDAADDLGKKTLSLADALDKSKFGTEEAMKALREYNEEQDRARDGAERMIKINLASAEARLKDALATRAQLEALLELESARNPAASGIPGYAGYQGNPAAAAAANLLAENKAQVDELNEALRNLRIEDAKREAEAAVDPIAAINNHYDDMAAAAEAAAAGNNDLAASLRGVLTEIERKRKAALDAERDAQRQARSTAALPPVSRSEVAQALGATITSGFRTPAQNAAIPGASPNSYHLGGPKAAVQAIDIPLTVNGKPFTKEGIRQVLEPLGVEIKELLGPGDKGHEDHFHIAFARKRLGDDQILKTAVAEADRLARIGDRASESIARINERFDEQPRLVDQAAQAARSLDATIAELGKEKPPGFEKMIEDAERAKSVIADALVRPLRELDEAAEKRVTTQRLLTAGREAEAEAMQIIWRLEDQLGPLTDARKQAVLDTVRYEHEVNKELEVRRELMGNFLDATRSIRGELESIFSGEGSIKNFGRIFRDLNAKITVEKLFGPALRELDEFVKGRSGISESVDFLSEETTRAGESALSFADAIDEATRRVLNPPSDLGTATLRSSALASADERMSMFMGRTGTAGLGIGYPANDNTITVTASPDSLMSLSPEEYFERAAKVMVQPLIEVMEQSFGPDLAKGIGGVLSGALYGYSTAGTTGGILGGLKGLLDQTGLFGGQGGALSGMLGGALGGAQTGTNIAFLSKALGLGGSTTGAQIGGALGSLIPIPGFDIVGAIAGNFLGSLFGGSKKGTATIGGVGGSLGVVSTRYGNDERVRLATDSAGDVIDTLDRIAEALGGTLAASRGRVSIGVRDDNWRVDPTGQGRTKGSGVLDFGEDQEAAVRAAIRDLINDGVLQGLRAGTLRLLKAGKDIEAQLDKALDFESVFQRLKARKDPIGAAVDALDKEFDHLRDIFREAAASAAEYAELEELYGLERAEAIEQATRAMTGALRGLLEDLTVNNSALSLRDRKALAQAAYDPLAARVAAGDITAFDDFADAARTLLEIERAMSGSQAPYFTLLDQVTTLTRTALDASTGPGSAQPIADNAAVVSAIDQSNAHLAAMNQNIGQTNALLEQNLLLWGRTGDAFLEKAANF